MYPRAAVALNPVSLQRFLSREAITRLALWLKWSCGVFALGCFAFVGWELYVGAHETDTMVGKLTTTVVSLRSLAAPDTTERPKGAPYNKIAERNIFGPMTVPSATTVAPPPTKPAAVTPLGLIGTFVAAGQAPYAIIEDQKKKVQDVFELNTSVFGEATLVAIYADRVDIDRNGRKETLVLDDMVSASRPESKDGIAALEDNEYIVDEAELDRALENLPLLLTQARAVPYFSDGQAVGLRLFAIKSGSLYEKIGLRNGDVLKSVNGNSMADLSQAMQLFEKLKTERSIALTIERNREEKEFKYQIR